MLLTLHSYKEKKYLDFRPLRTYDHFIDDVLFLLQKKCGEAKVSQTSNLPPPSIRGPFVTAFDYRASQQVVPNFCSDKNRETNLFQ